MKNKDRLVQKAGKIVYFLAAVLLVLALFFSFTDNGVNTTLLANSNGFLAFTFVSLALAVTPLRRVFPAFSLNQVLIKGRRALGVSAFVFALLHYSTHFLFTFSGKIEAVLFANTLTSNGFIAGYGAFAIFFLLFLTSTDYAVRKLGKNWFKLHKIVYLSYPLIIWHAVNVGTDFSNQTIFANVFFVIAIITILLEAGRIVLYFKQKGKSNS
jgi:sulfoxide reductase heme-binding subunit YedZ